MKKLFFILVSALFLATCSSGVKLTGQPAPEFTLDSFGGEAISPGELKGSPVMLYFFASW